MFYVLMQILEWYSMLFLTEVHRVEAGLMLDKILMVNDKNATTQYELVKNYALSTQIVISFGLLLAPG